MRYKLLRVSMLLVALAVAVWFVKGYSNTRTMFYGDVLGYYIYLPATFIYDNHEAIDKLPDTVDVPLLVRESMANMRNGYVVTKKGYVLVQYTYGMAVLEAPFFFLAHAYAKMTDLPATGYSPPYEIAIKISSAIYALLGCWFIYLILRRWYGRTHSLLATTLIFLGTNLFWFTLYQQGMAHVPLFFLYAVLVVFTVRLYEKSSWLNFLVLGFTAGFITVIRPTDVICLIIPAVYGVYNKETLRQRIVFLRTHIKRVLTAAVVFLLPIIPQLLYWKWMTGSYLFYSYGGQSFNWNDPKIIEGLFYYSNGWIPYSPIMLFALAGFFIYRYIKQWFWCLWVVFPLYVYIIYSWYCYNYINGLGSRPMIHIYPLLAIPLAAFLLWVWNRKAIVLKTAVALVCLFFVALNVSYSVQRSVGVMMSEESNFQYNAKMLFRTKLRYEDLVTFDIAEFQPDTAKIIKLKTLACLNFNDSTSEYHIKDTITGAGYFYKMTDEYIPYSITLKYKVAELSGAKWMKCSGRFMYPKYPEYFRHLLILSYMRNGEFVSWKGCKIENKINPHKHERQFLEQSRPGEWGAVYFFARIPEDVKDDDDIKVELWNIGKLPMLLDDICIEAYR